MLVSFLTRLTFHTVSVATGSIYTGTQGSLSPKTYALGESLLDMTPELEHRTLSLLQV